MRTNTTTTRKTEGLGNTKNPTLATSTHTPKGVSPRYSDLLGCMKYNRDGGMNTPDNAWHDEHFYCKAVEVVTTTADGKNIVLDTNPYEWFCYSVAKKWLHSRDWLPEHTRDASQVEEHRAIAKAISGRDGALAKQLMRSHLKKDYGIYLESPELLEQ